MMTHRERIIAALRGMPRGKGNSAPSLPRTVLEGMARLKMERRAAPAVVNLMIAQGELVAVGATRGLTFKLGKVIG